MKLLLPLLLTLSSCSFIAELDSDDAPFVIKGASKEKLSLVFSHNINGETHPCGCRHFPLGGLPQVAGQLELLRKDSQILYVDSGDMLFPSSTLPSSIKESLTFAAKNLVKAQEKMGLDYFTPGDQDFAAGLVFLQTISKTAKFDFLVSNLKDPKTLKHKRWAKIEKGPHSIYLTGVVWKENLKENHDKLFTDEIEAVRLIQKEMSSEGYRKENPFHRLIVISSGGIENDEKMAKEIKDIDWIIGGHSQSFTQEPIKLGNVQLVQALSRNHYMGKIAIDFTKSDKGDTFKILEIREDLAKELTPNPWISFIDEHKKKLTEIQMKEQETLPESNGKIIQFDTAASCLDCHGDQAEHWQKTSHSIAYATLINAKEEFNLSCVKCHALGTNRPKGFNSVHKIIQTTSETSRDSAEKKPETEKLKKIKKEYWDSLKGKISKIKSVRELPAKEIEKISKQWMALDEKHDVAFNYANVQCLNCHDKSDHHPFESSSSPISKTERKVKIKNKCLSCHDPDQSPQWYQKKGRGPLDHAVFEKQYLKMACPEKTE